MLYHGVECLSIQSMQPLLHLVTKARINGNASSLILNIQMSLGLTTTSISQSKQSYVIQPTSSELEYHFLVQQDCSYSNEELIKMVTTNRFAEHHNSIWFVGNVIFNLYNTVALFKRFVDLSHSKLLLNAGARQRVQRSKLWQGESLDPNTKLVAMEDQVDQNGWLATPKNMEHIPKRFLHGMEDMLGEGSVDNQKARIKLELMRTSDFVLDGFVRVRYRCADPVLTC